LVPLADGAPMLIVGTVLSTVIAALTPEAGARLPSRSTAVPAAREIFRVPLPLMELSVTVRMLPELPSTETMPSAVPVLVSVISAIERLLEAKFVSP